MHQLARRFLFLYACIAFFLQAQAQNVDARTASEVAMGGAVVSLGGAEFHQANPSAGANVEFCVGVSVNNRFSLGELSTANIWSVVPLHKARILAHISQFGSHVFQESLAEFGLARGFSPSFSMGLNFRYYQLASSQWEENPAFFSPNLGVQYQTANWGVGASVLNLFGQSVNQQLVDMDYRSSVKLGAHQNFQQFRLSSQIDYVSFSAIYISIGLSYNIRNVISLQSGYQGEGESLSFGMSYIKHKFKFDFAFSQHQYLGFSPSFAIIYTSSQ
ncbi:MAG: hypothetical protein ACK5JS_00345 [Mangrovibacterium sp.]